LPIGEGDAAATQMIGMNALAAHLGGALRPATHVWLPWALLSAVVIVMFLADLGVLQRRPRDPTTREALAWSGAWLGVATLFGLSIAVALGPSRGVEFFAAYFVEQGLSVDNLFVMMLVFAELSIPRAAQRKVLLWGILGAVVLRGVLIFTGTALVAKFHFLTYVLGAFLIAAAGKLARDIVRPDPPSDAAPPSRVRTALGRILPITSDFEGARFTTIRDGVRHATPVLLAVVTIEIADAIFALDSIPAVLGISDDAVIVFTSNLFAVLGLRSLYFSLSGLLERLVYLKHGLVGVLLLVGVKMLAAAFFSAPAWLTLALVASILGVAVVASLVRKPIHGESNAE
jgi:tellurite resistance protein TerC